MAEAMKDCSDELPRIEYGSLTIEKNVEKIKMNLVKIIQETLKYNFDMMLTSFGYILRSFENPVTRKITIDLDDILLDKALSTKLQFLGLLNFRRVLNTLKGASEDFLDSLVMFNNHLPDVSINNGFAAKDLVNFGMQHNFLNNVTVTGEKYQYLESLTLSSFIDYMESERQELFLIDYMNEANVDAVDYTVSSKVQISRKRLLEGVERYTDTLKIIEKKDREIDHLKSRLGDLNKDLIKIRSKMANGELSIGNSRIGSARSHSDNLDLDIEESLFDKPTLDFMKGKMRDMRDQYEIRIQRNSREIKDLRSRLSQLVDTDSSDHTYANELVKRTFNSVGKKHLALWKLLENNLGGDWFHSAFLYRTDRALMFNIDYKPIDDIIPLLIKKIVKEQLDNTDFLKWPNGFLISCIIDTFKEKIAILETELEDRDRLIRDLDVSIPGEEGYERPSHTEMDEVGLKDKTISQVLSQKVDLDLEQLKNKERHANEISKENLRFKARERMLLVEIKNLQKRALMVENNLATSEERNVMLSHYIQQILEKSGEYKKGDSDEDIEGIMKAISNLDGDILMRKGITKLLVEGNRDLIAKLAIHSSSNSATTTKATNTEGSEYIDLAKDSELIVAITTMIGSTTKNSKEKSPIRLDSLKSKEREYQQAKGKTDGVQEQSNIADTQSDNKVSIGQFEISHQALDSEIVLPNEKNSPRNIKDQTTKESTSRNPKIKQKEKSKDRSKRNKDSLKAAKNKRTRPSPPKRPIPDQKSPSSISQSPKRPLNSPRIEESSPVGSRPQKTVTISRILDSGTIQHSNAKSSLRSQATEGSDPYNPASLKVRYPQNLDETIEITKPTDISKTVTFSEAPPNRIRRVVDKQSEAHTGEFMREKEFVNFDRVQNKRSTRLRVRVLDNIYISLAKDNAIKPLIHKMDSVPNSVNLEDSGESLYEELESDEEEIYEERQKRLNELIIREIKRVDEAHPANLSLSDVSDESVLKRTVESMKNRTHQVRIKEQERERILREKLHIFEQKRITDRQDKINQQLSHYLQDRLSEKMSSTMKGKTYTSKDRRLLRKTARQNRPGFPTHSTKVSLQRVSEMADPKYEQFIKEAGLKEEMRKTDRNNSYDVYTRLLRKQKLSERLAEEKEKHNKRIEDTKWTLELLDKGQIMCKLLFNC